MSTESKPTIDDLFASYHNISAQRELLGDGIDPVLQQIKNNILAQAPRPSDEQLAISASWKEVVAATKSIGIEPPELNPVVAEALEAVAPYEILLQRFEDIGSTAVKGASAAEVAPVPPAPAPARAVEAASTPVPTPEPADRSEKKVHKAGTFEIRYDDETFAPQESVQDMYHSLITALAESPDGTVDTSEFLTERTGISVRLAVLAKSGNGDAAKIPVGVDIDEAVRVHKQFYGVLRTLKKRSLIHHEAGKPGSTAVNQRGIVQLFGPVNFKEEDGITVAELTRKPYHISMDAYSQTVNNGRDKSVVLEIDPKGFERVARAIGIIATKPAVETNKFSRSALLNWMQAKQADAELTTPGGKAVLSDYLKDLIAKFEGDFPLGTVGTSAGTRFTWEGASHEIIDGWPEKPDFNNAVSVQVTDGGVLVTIDGKEYPLFRYDEIESSDRIIFRGDKAELLERSRLLFAALSTLEANDVVTFADLISMVHKGEISQHETHILSGWIRSTAKKLNTLAGKDIINWRSFNGVLIDTNFKFVVKDDAPVEQTLQLETPERTPELATPELPSPILLETPATKPEEAPVRQRQTAAEIIADIEEMDIKRKALIYGCLVKNGRYEYPKTLAEAAYLMQLLTDSKARASIRETDRFANQEISKFDDFVTNALYVCWVRTLSWGSFLELYNAAKESNASPVEISGVQSMANSFEQARDQALQSLKPRNGEGAQPTKAQRRNRSYAESLVTLLKRGEVPEPRNAIQAIALLDVLRGDSRTEIAKGKTTAEFEALVAKMHGNVEKILGTQNAASAALGRRQGSHSGNNVALISSGGEPEFARRAGGGPRRHTRRGRPQSGRGRR